MFFYINLLQFSPLDPYYPLPNEDQLCLYKSGPPLPCYHPCKVWLHLVEKDIKIRRERQRRTSSDTKSSLDLWPDEELEIFFF